MDETAKPSSPKSTGISRREFARRAAIASAVATVAPAAALATTEARSTEPATVAAADRRGRLSATSSNLSNPESQQPANLPKLSPESQAEIDARIEAIFAQYGKRFSDEQKTDLRRLCAVAQPPLDRLRAYALENGDAPALYLKPLVEREKNPLENTRVGKTPDAPEKP
jgi:DNA anti-recombination protein RmuC